MARDHIFSRQGAPANDGRPGQQKKLHTPTPASTTELGPSMQTDFFRY